MEDATRFLPIYTDLRCKMKSNIYSMIYVLNYICRFELWNYIDEKVGKLMPVIRLSEQFLLLQL